MSALQIPTWTPARLGLVAAAVVLAIFAPRLFGSAYHASLTVSTCTLLILTLSMNLLVGTAGQFCLSHSAFYGIGAYTAALATVHGGVPMIAAGILSVAVAGAVAVVVGYPLLRLTGYFLATGSLAFALFVEVMIRQSSGILGGVNGIHDLPGIRLFGATVTGADFLPIAVIVCAAVVIGLTNLRSSQLGRAMIATKDSRDAAEAAGVHTDRIRLSAFTLASMLAAVAGWLQAAYQGSVDPHVFSVDLTFGWLFMIVIGGLGSVPGVIAATILLGIVPQVLGFANVQQVLVLGVLILFAVMFAPRGIAGLARSTMLHFHQKGRP